MPSSPEAVPAEWELTELRPGARMRPVPPPAFSAANEVRAALLPGFEVASSAVPDDLLAEARKAAQAAGYAAGWASGIQAARVVAEAEAHAARVETERAAAERRMRLQQAFTALDHAAAALELRAVPHAEVLEDLVVTSALSIAEALVGHALDDTPVRARDALMRVLSLSPAGEPVQVRMSPADYATLHGSEADSLVPQAIARSVELIEDATLQPGDAVATCGATEIDGRIGSGIARIREVLAR
jgi:flagellar assembly protein FliH